MMRILMILLLCACGKVWSSEKSVIVYSMEKCGPCAAWKARLTEWGIKYFQCGETAEIWRYPTTVILVDGKEFCRFSGMKTKEQLAEILK